ncbi:MAG: hypothetical protein HFE78_06455 [Clostridiales bacterium]|nr:hypothetical protein [Clostridiales bacterium]
MKKALLLFLSALMITLFTACGTEVIDDSSGKDDTEATQPLSKPINKVDENFAAQNGNASNMTEPTQNPTDPAPTDNNQDGNTAPIDDQSTSAPSFVTETLSTFPSNDVFDPEGKIIDESTNGDTTTYKVKYTKSLALIVNVTQTKETDGTKVSVKAYIQHYSLYMNEGKKATITIGSKATSAISPKVTREDASTAARTLLLSAENTVPSGEPFDLKVYMSYEGNYNKIYVKDISLEKTIMAK